MSCNLLIAERSEHSLTALLISWNTNTKKWRLILEMETLSHEAYKSQESAIGSRHRHLNINCSSYFTVFKLWFGKIHTRVHRRHKTSVPFDCSERHTLMTRKCLTVEVTHSPDEYNSLRFEAKIFHICFNYPKVCPY